MYKYLGQYFLINKSAIKKIIAALDIKPGETIVEIGPGKGALTIPLLKEIRSKKYDVRVIAIEKDPKLAFSVERLAVSKNLRVIVGDALKILPETTKHYTLYPKPYKLVGNIPYYITGHLLRIIGELKNKPELIALTIQKEVAERICAKAGEMNLLAASVQFWAEPKIIARLKPKDFSPSPKVDSAIIKLEIKPLISNYQLLITNYYRLIKIVFKQPRKTLLNNLSKGLKMNKTKTLLLLRKIGYNENSRPQDLHTRDLLTLTKFLW